MREYKPMRKYPAGSIIQQKTGYIFIKTRDGKWVSEHRYNYQQHIRPLKEGERVFHKNGDREDNETRNLVAIQFPTTRYALLPRRRIMFIPTGIRRAA